MKALSLALGSVLCSLFSSSISAQDSKVFVPKPDECKLSGMVVKLAGSEPLKNARVRLLSQDDRSQSHSVTTDAGGRFELKGIEPGRYRLVVHRDGFVNQAYGQRKLDDPGAVLALHPSQEMRDLLFRLIPAAIIAGRVINDDGDPLPWVQVSALREVYSGGKKTLTAETTVPTNDLGEYRLFGLRPGRYFLRANYRPNEQITGPEQEVQQGDDDQPRGYVPMYYPSSTDPERASPLIVKAGEEIPSLEILLRRVDVFAIRGRLYSLGPRRSNNSFNVLLVPKGENWLSLPQRDATVDHRDSTFLVRDVLPGPYILSATWFDAGRRYQSYQPIDLGNSDLAGVTLTLLPGATLNGRVTWDGSPALQGDRLIVYVRGEEFVLGNVAKANVTPGGTFALNDVHDLPYRLVVVGLGGDCYLKSVRYGGLTLPDDTFTPSRGTNGTLELTLSSKGARVQGKVVDTENLPAVGVWVALVPDEAHRAARRLYKSAVTDQYGQFDIHGIVPGDYKLFSWEEAESGAWEDPAFLNGFEDKGEKITLEEGEQKTRNLTAIGAKTPESVTP
jgi:hypothetical protein